MLDIAIGKSRKELNWRNTEMSWEQLVTKLSTTHRTHETFKEYMNAKKSRQDEIKDIGGFVGGLLTGGRRKSGSVAHRQLVTLDIDFAVPDLWLTFTLLYDCAALVYSTHKHTESSHRLRLVLPLDRPVMCDEYEAICRRIAGDLGIEQFDHTTYQPYRLMYWPSTSKDGDWLSEVQDGEWLCADKVLASYSDWRDSSQWPMSDAEQDIVVRSIKKQGDPEEKAGVVGAWCRTYDIPGVIDAYMSDIYEPCDMANRFSYKEGSTTGGLVCYEDKWVYSHHGTDPVSGKLCNSFDLVRLHRFGHLDDKTPPGAPINRIPSYNAMVEFATKDVAVKKQLGMERLQGALDDFKDVEGTGGLENADVSDTVEDDTWLEELDIDAKGQYKSTIENIRLILQHDPRLKGSLSLDLFEHREVALKRLPWWGPHQKSGDFLTDADDSGIRAFLEKHYNISSAPKIQDALNVMLLQNSVHPVKQYLDRCHKEWDGRQRLESLLIDFQGAADTHYTREVTRKTFTAAVARIFNPGCKFDYVLTLVGEEGTGKSTLVRRMGQKWFSDSLDKMVGKEAYEQLQGVWVVELAEMSAMNRSEVESVKLFVAKQVDRYRVAFGRRTADFPRQCIFLASTNRDKPLREAAGNRRFWAVDIHVTEPKYDMSKLTDELILQLWGEAVYYYQSGEPLYLDKATEIEAREIQLEHTESDDRTGLVEQYLETLLPENWEEKDLFARRAWLAGQHNPEAIEVVGTEPRTKVCAIEIWCEIMGGKVEHFTRKDANDIHAIMRHIKGWTKHEKGKCRFSYYGIQRAYVPVPRDVSATL